MFSLLRSCALRKPPAAPAADDVQPDQDMLQEELSPFDDFFAAETSDQAREELEAAAAEDAAARHELQQELDDVQNQGQSQSDPAPFWTPS